MFGEKQLDKMYIGVEFIPRIFCAAFSFSSVLTQHH